MDKAKQTLHVTSFEPSMYVTIEASRALRMKSSIGKLIKLAAHTEVICKVKSLRYNADMQIYEVNVEAIVETAVCHIFKDVTFLLSTSDIMVIVSTVATTDQIKYYNKMLGVTTSANTLEHDELQLRIAMQMIGIQLPDEYAIRLAMLLARLNATPDIRSLADFSLEDAADIEIEAKKELAKRTNK